MTKQTEKPIVFNQQMYEVEMTIWEGSGSNRSIALCRTLQDAVLVAQGLKAIFPTRLNSECGESKINRRVVIEVSPCHLHEVREFVELERW